MGRGRGVGGRCLSPFLESFFRIVTPLSPAESPDLRSTVRPGCRKCCDVQEPNGNYTPALYVTHGARRSTVSPRRGVTVAKIDRELMVRRERTAQEDDMWVQQVHRN